jgi:hypothetical protein
VRSAVSRRKGFHYFQELSARRSDTPTISAGRALLPVSIRECGVRVRCRVVKSTIILSVFLFAAGTLKAADWFSLGRIPDGDSEAYVDRETITVVGNVRSALFKYVPQRHSDMYQKEWIERSEQFSEYDCKKNAVHAMTLDIYLEGGRTHKIVLPAAWGSVTAPWDQAALNYLCAWQGD